MRQTSDVHQWLTNLRFGAPHVDNIYHPGSSLGGVTWALKHSFIYHFI